MDLLSGGGGLEDGGVRTAGRDDSAVGQYLAVVLEQDYAVAQQAPPLFGVAVHDMGGIAPGAVRWWAARLMGAHRVRLTHSFLLEIVRWVPAGSRMHSVTQVWYSPA